MKKNNYNPLLSLAQSILHGTANFDTAARLRAMGYPKSEELAKSFEKLALKLCADPPGLELFPMVIQDFLASPSPEGALLNLLRYMEITGSPRVLVATLAQAGPIREILAIIFGSSQYMADIVIRNPGYLYWLIEKHTWEEDETAPYFENELRREIANFRTLTGRLNAVRRFHRKALLRIGVADLLGQTSIETTTERLSNLADAIAALVLEIARDQLCQKTGGETPQPAAGGGFVILALGKLGGRELNYSSDIDLIYLCRDADDAMLSFYRSLAQAVTEALAEVSEEGYLYRVDLRLRPDGVSGPVVNTLTSMRIYYENRGKPWEFQAMLKARSIAGDLELGDSFLKSIANLVFNPSLPYSPVEDIANMRQRIHENIPIHERPLNIKLMEGGVRDIEFIVQTLQLLHGSTHPDIRRPGTLAALDRILEHKLLRKKEAASLADAYRFLRLVEHRLQMMHQIKTHTVPQSPREIELLAARASKGPLGSFNHAQFIDKLSKHLNNVRILSESFFTVQKQEVHSLLFLMPETNPEANRILEQCGVLEPENAIKVIHTMAYGSFPRLLDRNIRKAFADLLPRLLESVSLTGDPGLTLTNIARITSAGKSEYTFYKLLRESNGARSLVSALAGVSSRLTGNLCSRIETLDPLLTSPEDLIQSSLAEPAAWGEIKDKLASPGRLDERAIESLQKKHKQIIDWLHLGAFLADYEAASFPFSLSRARASLAKRLLANAFEQTVGDLLPAALFTMGSFGTAEPRYDSDVDLLVVSDVENPELITRIIQTINRVFAEGRIFKLDFRLRGEGANAPLVQNIDFYRNYFNSRMSIWERIAFSKFSFWWGAPKIAAEINHTLAAILARPFSTTELESLKLMRKKLESLAMKVRDTWETKRSPGGRYDVEYLCGIGTPLAADQDDFPFEAGTAERLELLAGAGLITAEDRDACTEALTMFTRLEYILELQGYSCPQSDERESYLERYVTKTMEFLGCPLRAGIKKEIQSAKHSVRGVFDRFLDRL